MYRQSMTGVLSTNPHLPDSHFVRLPCGKCIGCLMEARQMWAMRCRDEASFWDHNVFLTLTYDDDHVPPLGSLDFSHVQLFLKRLRQNVARRRVKYKALFAPQAAPSSEDGVVRYPVRYFGCGEYGSRTFRPHYHLLLFNLRISDSVKYGQDTFTSPSLSKLWTFGSHLLGAVSPASIAYTAGYIEKKLKAKADLEDMYEVIDFRTGEVLGMREREDNFMSTQPGIGQYWYDKYKDDLRNGVRVVDGVECPIPRFYQDQFKRDFPEKFEAVEYDRHLKAMARDPEELSPNRLVVKELVARARKRLFARVSSSEV